MDVKIGVSVAIPFSAFWLRLTDDSKTTKHDVSVILLPINLKPPKLLLRPSNSNKNLNLRLFGSSAQYINSNQRIPGEKRSIRRSVMEAGSVVFSSRFSCPVSPSFGPPEPNKRGLLVLPVGSSRRCIGIGINMKSSSLCPKAAQRANLEATGVPTSVPVRVAHELLQAGHRYLDVRTPEEFSAGHAEGAINVPYMYRVGSGMNKNSKFLEEVSSHFGKYDEIIVGCQSGKRSLMAAADLLACGYTAVTDIAGGYAAWTQNGLPTQN